MNSLFVDGGETGAIMQTIDWSATPLGSTENWSPSLKVALRILLSSRFPMQILWGKEYVQFYNDAYIAIAGAKHPQGLGQRAKDCWAEVWDFAEPLLDQVMAAGKATWSEDQPLILHRNGYPEECYFTFSYSPIWDEPDTVGGIFIAITETTQRILGERRQQALRAEVEAAKDSLERVLSSIHDECVMLDQQWRYTYVNDSAVKTLGKPREELLGRSIWDLFPDAIGNPFYVELHRVMTEKKVSCFEHFSERWQRWFENRAYPSEDGILLFCADITDRKQIEERLRQSEARFQRLATNVPGVIYRYLLRSDGSDAFTYISPSCREMLDLEPETIQNDSGKLWAMVHPDDVECLKVSIALSSKTLQPSNWEGRLLTATGQLRWLQGVSRPERQANGDMVWDGLLIDITHLKEVEAEREQLFVREQVARQQAETANRIKDEFLAVLSHELRSPLNPILGWAKLLRQRTFDPETTTRALETIERNAKLQAQLIEDLLDVSRILRGKLSLDIAPVDLASTIEAAIETVRLVAEAKDITIQMQLAQNLGQIAGDANRLQQVFWNFLSNAVKFTPVGGRVEVSLERIDDSVKEVGSEAARLYPFTRHFSISRSSLRPYAQIRVTDTGKGIHSSFLPYIFDYFRQADNATTRNSGGLGLGLAIARHIVELHGGVIAAASPGEGKGATFLVQLPIMPGLVPSQPIDRSADPHFDLRGMRILVVDDEADSREVLTMVLVQHGAEVTTAATVNEALMTLVRSQPDLLLSDIAMPEMDGYALMQQVRRLPNDRGGQISAIAVTAYASDHDKQRALEAGFQKHLAKPIDPTELVAAVASLLPPQ